MITKRTLLILAAISMLNPSEANALEPDWSENFTVEINGRPNPYHVTDSELPAFIRSGRLHALSYPVDVTGILLPYEPIDRSLRAEVDRPFLRLMYRIFGKVSSFRKLDDLQKWLGLHEYPASEGEGPYFIPFKDGVRPKDRMGFTVMETSNGRGFTISCAECHSSNLFGKRVMGLTNRFPRANRAFAGGLKVSPHMPPLLFQWATSASKDETAMYRASRTSFSFIAAKDPVQLGLDTSLAQVALSLAKRARDPWATRVAGQKARPEKLASFVADSKPAVWWNVKYKNRWLSDGSVVSGNPIFTNILWNEIGRGTDLKLLSDWIDQNSQIIAELTTAVFSSEAPHYTEFFPAESIPLNEAKQGQVLFNRACARCHGTYLKAWEESGANNLTLAEKLKTVQVRYDPVKPVFDVGTDPQRYQGMESLEGLNDLEISKRNNIRIESQVGYVPPPLVGIWARWPYFHNNSAPTLCAVLTRASERPKTYWARAAINPRADFDSECNGYPERMPAKTDSELFYDTRRAGMRNTGHDERIFLKDGREIFSNDEKLALVKFLQTL